MKKGSWFDRLKFVYDWFDGKIPTKEEFIAKGDPLGEWYKDKGKSWRKQNNKSGIGDYG